MSIAKFASFSYAKQPTSIPYIQHDKPLRSYYRNRIIRSSLTSAGSGDLQPKPFTVPKSNRNNNLTYVNKTVALVPTLEENFVKPIMVDGLTKYPSNGIGITKFIEEKSFLITGATGFLSQVFMEKMLRTAPDIRKIYLLIRAADEDAAMKRLKHEILDFELFKNLKEIHGNLFEEFVMSKVVPVAGNVCEPNLGIDPETAYKIASEVDAIVNAAAITTFDARYDLALEVNTKGPCQLISFAKKCKKLKVFLHFSTAFAIRDKNGVIFEEPLYLKESLPNGTVIEHSGPKTLSQMDIDAELDIALKSREPLDDQDMVSKLKELGLERATLYGWPNTYSFTKAMGEMLMNDQRGDVPLVIIRPSVIESTYTEPFPGWIQGNRVMDPFITYYAKGQLQGVWGDPDGCLNIVPADMVVNASLAAMAEHGIKAKPGLHVYHATTPVTNPFLFGEFFSFLYDYFLSDPFTDSEGNKVSVSEMKYFSTIEELSTFLLSPTEVKEIDGLKKLKRKIKPLLHLSKLYQPYTFYKECIQSENTKMLMEYMSHEEKKDFDFHFEGINWGDYMLKVHIPGVIKHILKGRKIVYKA